jgi:hypothetical protein
MMIQIELGFILILTLSKLSLAQLPSEIKTEDKLMRENMIKMSRQLGTTCNTCHDPANFTSSDKLAYKIAKEHLKITQLLIDVGITGPNGPTKVDCYMCHRGKLKPDWQEPFDPMTMKKELSHESKKQTEKPNETPAKVEKNGP